MVDRVIKLEGRGLRGESYADTARRSGLFGILPTDDDETVIGKINADAEASAGRAELAAEQATDLVLPENRFVAADLATARSDGEAAMTAGTYFIAVGEAEGEAEVRLRTAGGSDLIYTEITKAALASTDPGKGAGMVGYDPTNIPPDYTVAAELRAIGRKAAERLSSFDNLPSQIREQVESGAPGVDLKAYLDEQIQNLKGSKTLVFGTTSVRYGSKCLHIEPGMYDIHEDILIDGDITLVCEAWGGAIFRYMGTGAAITINSDNIGTYVGAPQNVRNLTWSGISIYAPNAQYGILIGTASQRHLTIERGAIWGPEWGVYCGQSVYFLRLSNMDIRGCGVGIYAGAYCDLLTVDDRCLFHRNRECDLDIEAPTYLIHNNDFEGADGARSAIRIARSSRPGPEIRAGSIDHNRFGPEGANTYDHDILITDIGSTGAMDCIKITRNIHFSRDDERKKTSPVHIEGKVKRLTIDGNKQVGGFDSPFYVTGDPVLATAAGFFATDNFIDDILTVADDMKSLFARTRTKGLRAVQAGAAVSKGRAVRYTGVTSSANFLGAAAVAHLNSSTTSINYSMYAGIAIHDASVSRPVWLAEPGYVFETTLDSTGAAIGDPAYLQSTGYMGLSPANVAFRLGRLLSVGANAKVLIQPEDHTGT